MTVKEFMDLLSKVYESDPDMELEFVAEQTPDNPWSILDAKIVKHILDDPDNEPDKLSIVLH